MLLMCDDHWADNHLVGCLYFISQFPLDSIATSFAIISISFACSSRRFDNTARIRGTIPLDTNLDRQCQFWGWGGGEQLASRRLSPGYQPTWTMRRTLWIRDQAWYLLICRSIEQKGEFIMLTVLQNLFTFLKSVTVLGDALQHFSEGISRWISTYIFHCNRVKN